MRPVPLAVVFVAAGVVMATPAVAGTPPDICANQLSIGQGSVSGTAISAKDLIEMSDIGYPAPIPGAVTLTMSPDGQKVAFPIQRADLASDGYCSAIVVLNLATKVATLVGQSRGLAKQGAPFRGPVVPNAAPAFVVARWSPDGQWLAFLRPDKGTTALWRVHPDGSALAPVTRDDVEVEDFTWSDDSRMLIISQRPSQAVQDRPLAEEGSTGFRFDDRFLPLIASRPFPLEAPQKTMSVNPVDAVARTASTAETRLLEAQKATRRSPPGRPSLEAWIARQDKDRIGSPRLLHVSKDGVALPCPQNLCRDALDAWWSADGKDLAFLRKEGWAGEDIALYDWSIGRPGGPRRVLATSDFLDGCTRAARQLVCAREASTVPRHIVGIDIDSGRSGTLFDPNPTYPSAQSRPATRLHWSTAAGSPVIADLVLPIGYQKGHRYPLVITTYQTRGFLRGGTGDEYPVQLFAARGMAVLSLDRPGGTGSDKPGVATVTDEERLETRNWSDRDNVQSAVANGISLLVADGLVDRTKIGITGLSDGSETVTYGLIHDPDFAAAAISNCCNEPESFLALGGPVTARYFRSIGYPRLTDHDRNFWAPASLAYNAHAIKTPLLMQLPEREFPLSLQSLEALREAGAPVEAYVFPDEGHVKLDPLHRLAIYNRNLAWFDFWLRGKRDADLASDADYARWDRMRAAPDDTGPAPAPRQ